MTKISVYTILYHDLQFYEDIIKNIYSIVDEIVIIDGPYSYAIETLKQFNLFYDESNKPDELTKIIKKYPKIKYKYVVCDTEEEKRMIGYNMCTNNLILLVDTDEFLYININRIRNFIRNNNKFVGCANIYNMCDYNVNYNKLCQKYILFKKEKISALEHLNYTWLIGCKQTEKNEDYMFHMPFGLIFHQTLCRNKQNNIVKFIFYILLHFKTNKKLLNILVSYDNSWLLTKLPIKDIVNIFVHSRLNSVNIPSIADNNRLELIHENMATNLLKKYSSNSSDFIFNEPTKFLRNVPVFFRLKNLKNDTKILFTNVKSVAIKMYYIYLEKPYIIKQHTFHDIEHDKEIIFSNDLNGREYCVVIEMNCYETVTDEPIFTIESIL
jgi:hypothetical protein